MGSVLRMPPITRQDTVVSLDGALATLVRLRDGEPLLVVSRETVADERLGRLGYANPHAALYDVYAAEFDREFLDQLQKGVIR